MLLSHCSLVIGDIPGPLDPSDDSDGGVSSGRDAGVESPVDNSGNGDASVVPSTPDADAAVLTDTTSNPTEETAVSEDTTPSDSEALADASPSAAEESNTTTATMATDGTETAGMAPCDRDEDGVESEACGGEDCDDDDPDVHPGQTRYFVDPSERIGFDYDCSGSIDRDPSEPGLSCSLELAACDPTLQGFMGETLPACGEQRDWGQCAREAVVGVPGTCVAQKLEERRASCR